MIKEHNSPFATRLPAYYSVCFASRLLSLGTTGRVLGYFTILRAMRLYHLLPTLLLSTDGMVSRRDNFSALERGDISVLLHWLTTYMKGAAARRQRARDNRSGGAALDRAQLLLNSKGVRRQLHRRFCRRIWRRHSSILA